jgi:hypothetical protein
MPEYEKFKVEAICFRSSLSSLLCFGTSLFLISSPNTSQIESDCSSPQ